ncbi:MAG: hypothetical protein OQK12_01710 [Motiliproteus sp.]|nr:hypothetical protein [Motiliproteus sp.]MCW9053047.1 hypothetical protein [Motiliproteus sp.]
MTSMQQHPSVKSYRFNSRGGGYRLMTRWLLLTLAISICPNLTVNAGTGLGFQLEASSHGNHHASGQDAVPDSHQSQLDSCCHLGAVAFVPNRSWQKDNFEFLSADGSLEEPSSATGPPIPAADFQQALRSDYGTGSDFRPCSSVALHLRYCVFLN